MKFMAMIFKSSRSVSLIFLIATALLFNLGCINSEKPSIVGEIVKTPDVNVTTIMITTSTTTTPTITTTPMVETTTVEETTTTDTEIYQNAFEACDAISHMSILDWCYVVISNNVGDQDVCELIDGANYKRYCLATTQVNPNICDEIGRPYLRGECLTHISLVKNDPGICKKIGRRDSEDWCLVWNALNSGNRSLCSEIYHKNRMRFCEAGLDMNVSPCYGISLPTLQGFCITNVAWQTKNVSLCEKISGVDRTDRCYLAMAQRMKDLSLCSRINDRDHVKFCKALMDVDIEKCKTISRLSLAEECYVKVAYLTLQSEDEIESWRGLLYWYYLY